jgi:mRNA interferase MazF
MIQKLKLGAIWLANLNPSKGTEPGKTRPVLIVQNQALLDVDHPSSLIIPLTTQVEKEELEPLRIHIPAQDRLLKHSALLIDQLRAIDNKRLIEGPLAQLSPSLMRKVYHALSIVLGDEHTFRT